VDLRDADRPPLLREGQAWENTRDAFIFAAQNGADILSVESIGGKEVHDEALMYGDLTGIIVGLGSLAWRDTGWLWDEITKIAFEYNCIPGGDSACGFSNTAMQLAGKGMLPSVLAAIDRAASAPRSLAAYEHGAIGPSKDCAYEGPILKVICGVPISMEGKSSSCAHFSPLGNIAGAAADLWSNESVQNIRLLSGSAPEAFLELLAYDCRLFNKAGENSDELKLRDWLVQSDVPFSVEALMLEPKTVIDIARSIIGEEGGYKRTVAATKTAFEAIQNAIQHKVVSLPETEKNWLEKLDKDIANLPESEAQALEYVVSTYGNLFRKEAYGL
jgi:methanol--5-hydroxybenzimidazolylcobamide Co-methyltransferase